jgi:ribosomal protein S18 acetylase RimI-like enzyme
MLQKLSIAAFDSAFSLLEESFPLDEYRPYDAQRALLQNPQYSIYILPDEASREIKALVTVWQFKDFAFIEHLAVAPECRNQGIGAALLCELRKLLACRLVLEVELPETEMAKRRIGFYQRNGFSLNQYPYSQPSYGKGRSPVPLLLMTTEGGIDQTEFERMKETLYRVVYGK